MHADTLERFADAFAPMGFDPLAFCPAYGMAEATLAVTIVRRRRAVARDPAARRSTARPDLSARPLVSTGPPLGGVDVRVDAPPTVRSGTIEFRSGSQLSRYIGADLTLTDDGYFVTGDLGLIDDGELFVIGRGDEAIVVAGRNLYPGRHRGRGASRVDPRRVCIAAVAAPDGGSRDRRGAERRRRRRSPSSRPRAAASAPRSRAAPAARRSTVAFVPRGSLPKTPSGKLRRLADPQGRCAADDGILARKDFG